MPNKKRWQWGVRTIRGHVEMFGTGPAGKKEAKNWMLKTSGDVLVRRFVGRWRND